MIKRAASLILSASITVGTIPVFAEPNLNDEQNNDIISTEAFTDENVIYSALQNMNDVVSLFSDAPDEIAADFDVVLGFDMSSDMYGFDYNGEMAWKDDFAALQEQAPARTRFSVVTGKTGEFGTDLNSMISALPDTYSGSTDIVTLLENCSDTFDDESNERNKVVIAVTGAVNDSESLEIKMDELRSEGIIPFVFVLDDGTEQIDINNTYTCETNLQFDLAVSDLYLSFAEFKTANNVSTLDNIEENTNEDYISDFRNKRHNFNFSTADFTDVAEADRVTKSFGMGIASILNIYGCLPSYAANGSDEYNLFVDNENSDLSSIFDLLYNLNTGKAYGITSFDKMRDVFDFWDNMKGTLESSGENAIAHISHGNDQYIIDGAAQDKLTANLKRRFPVLLKIYNNTYIITKYNKTGETITMDVYDYTSAPQEQESQLIFNISGDNWVLSDNNTNNIYANDTQHEYNTMIFDMYSYINSYASAYNVTLKR